MIHTRWSAALLFVLLAGLLGACAAAEDATPTEPAATRTSAATPTEPAPATPTLNPPTATPAASPEPTEPAATPTEAVALPTMVPLNALAAGQPVTVTRVQMLDAASGWAVGVGASDANDHVLRTDDGGATWRDVSPPEVFAPADPNAGKAATAFFLDSGLAWVAYYDRLVAPLSSPVVVWRTQDGGESWTLSAPLDASEAESFFPSDLTFVDPETGWLMAHVGAGMSHDYVLIFATTDGGSRWKKVVDPFGDTLPMSCAKTGLTFRDAQTGWVAGDCGGVVPGPPYLQKTTDGGLTWLAEELPAPAEAPDLFEQDTTACGTNPPVFVSPELGRLAMSCFLFEANELRAWQYATADGGQTWSASPLPGPYPTFGQPSPLVFISPSVGWYLSVDTQQAPAQSQLYQTQDGGQTWAPVKALAWSGLLDFVSEQQGWAVAQAEEAIALVRTGDGGATWVQLIPQIGP